MSFEDEARLRLRMIKWLGPQNFTLVVGNGLTIASGGPRWDNLLRKLLKASEQGGSSATDTGRGKVVSRWIDEGDLSTEQFHIAASWVKDTLARQGRWPEAIKEILGNLKPADIHLALAGVARQAVGVVTTNYGTLLEASGLRSEQVVVPSLDPVGTLQDFKAALASPPYFLKLHGSIDRGVHRQLRGVNAGTRKPEWRPTPELVLCRADYCWLELKHRNLLDELAHSLRTSPPIFIGYGFGDPDIRRIMAMVRSSKESDPEWIGPDGLILLEAKSGDPVEREMERLDLEKDFGLSVIQFSEGQYDDVLMFVRLLGEVF